MPSVDALRLPGATVPPDTQLQEAVIETDDSLASVKSFNAEVILSGDWNSPLDKCTINPVESPDARCQVVGLGIYYYTRLLVWAAALPGGHAIRNLWLILRGRETSEVCVPRKLVGWLVCCFVDLIGSFLE